MQLIVHLIPKASSTKIVDWSQDAEGQQILRVKVTAVPEEGKANRALIKLLSKTLKLPQSKIVLIKGKTSRFKVLEIDADVTLQDVIIPAKAGIQKCL